MTSSRWEKVHKEQHSLDEQTISSYFNEHLIAHLKKQHDPEGEKNQPHYILNNAQQSNSSIGILSRIFDAFSFPTTPYSDLQAMNKQTNGLRHYMNEVLSSLLPILLNANQTALNQNVIDAIGPEGYEKILGNGKGTQQDREKGVALQFVKSVLLSYAQRVLDSITDPTLKVEAYKSIMPQISLMAEELTLNGLPEKVKIYEPSEPKQIITEFMQLLTEATELNINIPDLDKMMNELDGASEWLNEASYGPIEMRTEKAIAHYDKAVDLLMELPTYSLATDSKPAEVNWFIKALRFITSNEKLLQNSDEKRYERQIELLPKINGLINKANSIQEQQTNYQEQTQEAEHQSIIKNNC